MAEWHDAAAADAPAAPAAGSQGELRRFVLEGHPVRAFWAQLDGPWRELCSLQPYPPPVRLLLAEAVTASVLLAATLKFHGTLTLQLQGNGAVRLLVAQCTHDLRIRGLARVARPLGAAADFRQLVGDSRLVVTVESEEQSARYQGIVQLEGGTLAACLENYFATSEQLPTHVALSADAAHARGVLLQRMPDAAGEVNPQAAGCAWDQARQSLSALPAAQLLQASAEQVLWRIGAGYDGRVFAGNAVRFACRCSASRVVGLLRSLGAAEIRSVLAEQGAVTVTCEFCGRPYRFDAIDVEQLFADGAAPSAPYSLN